MIFAGHAIGETTRGFDSARDATTPVWVFFVDKGFETEEEERSAISRAESALSDRALSRRAKVRGRDAVDLLDVPVCRQYLREVLHTGASHRTTSRWLNAVSVDATPSQIAAIEALGPVTAVRSVARGRHVPIDVAPVILGPGGARRYTLDYGDCLSQLEPIQVPLLHDQGLSGAGVLICMLDTGYLRIHDALVGVHVAAEWDFINDDSVTANQPGDAETQQNHGTYTLSLIGGHAPGHLIGPAYGADYALAKTEDISGETPVEEDYWVEGIEWADSLGADVASSSLSYTDWYTYEDMDGNTAVTTIAADLAVQNGIAVVVSAGNKGASDWHYIGAPADGDSVLAIGAVDSLGVLADWSSRGPSYDGRLKPDLVAMGVSDLVALVDDPHGYGRGSGTSFSCPLVAGVSALLLESHPDWVPMEVAEALKMTALNADHPDSNYGWGLIQAADADRYLICAAHRAEPAERQSIGCALRCYPNPCWGNVTLSLSLPTRYAGAVELGIYDAQGRRVRTLVESRTLAGDRAVRWDGRDQEGCPVAAGVYFARLKAGETETRSPIVLLR